MAKKVEEPDLNYEADHDVSPLPPAPDINDHEDRLGKLEAWARETHSTPFKHGVKVITGKVFAYYTRPDGEIEKHHMFSMDYESAKKQAPDLWTTDEPAAGVEVLDKTRLRGWEAPDDVKEIGPPKPEELETDESKAASTGPHW